MISLKVKKAYSFFLLLCFTLVPAFAESKRRYKSPEECVYATTYKSFLLNKKENEQIIIEKELFGNQNYSDKKVISSCKDGTHFSHFFYKINEDYICLGIKSFNSLQEDSVIYLNTQKECVTKCKVYLSDPENKQIYYFWEPNEEIITDNNKDKLEIVTDKQTYIIYVKTGIKELELNIGNFPKIKKIKGLEKFPYLINLSLVGFDY